MSFNSIHNPVEKKRLSINIDLKTSLTGNGKDEENSKDNMYLKTKAAYDNAIRKSREKPLVIEFFADWSPPCRKIGYVYEELVASYPKLTLKKVDIEANPKAAKSAGVCAFPTYMIFI